jgi:hypothetical protein
MMPVLASISVQVGRAMKDPVSQRSSALTLAVKRERSLTGYVCFVFGCVCNSIGSDYTGSSDASGLSA